MAIQYTIQGLLIYEAMGLYVLALLMGVLGYRRLSLGAYGIGFLAAAAAVVYRGLHVGYFPLQNLFDVFLFLGAAVFPITLASVNAFKTTRFMADIVIGIILLFPVGFVFSAQPQPLPPALQSILFVPHVLVYLLAYVVLAKAAVSAGAQFFHTGDHEKLGYRFACAGFPLLTVGLILGSVWGKLAWGDYWNWDPKEMWSLTTWLVYAGYFHFRARYAAHKKACAAWLAVGLACIVITLLWVNLSRIFAGLHSYA